MNLYLLYSAFAIFIYIVSVISFKINIIPIQEKIITDSNLEGEEFFLNGYYIVLLLKSFFPIFNLYIFYLYLTIFFDKNKANFIAYHNLRAHFLCDQKYFQNDIKNFDNELVNILNKEK